jgi:hypothetical protein
MKTFMMKTRDSWTYQQIVQADAQMSFPQFAVPVAKQAAENGELDAWIHAYLTSGYWANEELSNGLKLQPRWWHGPLELPLSEVTRCCGPEPHMPFRWDPEVWAARTAQLARSMTDLLAIPPLIAEYCHGTLHLRDGNTRHAVMERKGWSTCWVLIWYNSEAEYRQHLTVLHDHAHQEHISRRASGI